MKSEQESSEGRQHGKNPHQIQNILAGIFSMFFII